MPLTTERKIVLAFAVTVAALALMVGGAWRSISRFEATFGWVDHTHQVLYELEALVNHIQTVQIESQRFVITANPACLDRWAAGEKLARLSYQRLTGLMADNPAQLQHVEELLPLIERTITLTQARNELRQRAGLNAAAAVVAQGEVRAVVDEITSRMQRIEAVERGLLGRRGAETQTASDVVLQIIFASSAMAAALAGFGLYLAMRDLAARKKAEAELDRFFTLTHDLLCIAGYDGYFHRINPAWSHTLGYSMQELLATPYLEFLHPEDVEATKAQASRQAVGKDAVSFVNRYRCKDGSYRWLEWNARPVESAQLIFATARDITDRKKLEQIHLQFRSLFESLPGLYIILTPDFKITAASDAYLKATMRTRDGILGRNLFDVFPDNPEDPSATGTTNLRSSLQRVLQSGAADTMAIQKYDVARPDGTFEERFWSPINSPVFGADRQVEFIVHRVEDVTDFVHKRSGNEAAPTPAKSVDAMEAEIYRSAQKIQAANEQLHAVNAELEAFSYSVSHDLRAPLRHIDGFAGLLTKHATDTMDEKSRRYVDVISEAARKMGRLIDDLLSFSRAGRTPMRRALVNQDELVASVIRDGRFDRPEHPIDWHISALPEVQADPAMLRQVWFNFIDNAVKYSGKSAQPRIEIGAERDAKTGQPAFFIRDNGAGFDMRYVDKLFGVFQRLHTDAEFEGTGIGLANVRRIVARHGGRTWAEGSLGAGSVFYFTLPADSLRPVT